MTRIHHSILASLWMLLCCCSSSGSEAFTIAPIAATTTTRTAAVAASRGATTAHLMSAIPPNTTASPNTKKKSTQDAIANLKKVLEREYVSMFDPMRTEFYSKDVTFDDPLTTLTGVQAYQNNVDMLASRTLLGRLLFRDGSIVLHSITGGEEKEDGTGISDIVTRWTLRFTFQALPWAPTARFSGISVYSVVEGGSEGVLITAQADYWDSINKMNGGGSYQKVSKLVALKDFLQQLQPGGLVATTAAPEVPYQLLSRANGYQVRRYPSFSAVKIKYERRDEGFGTLGAFTKGMNPLSPAIMEVQNSKDKYMLWPLTFAAPGQDASSMIPEEAKLQISQGQYKDCELVTVDSQVLAVAEFTDASMEPVVRRVDQELRQMLERDGLFPKNNAVLQFAQYDAIFSIGKRRGEVWIPLRDGGHPW